ncbi:MAG: hypothetical protein ACRYGF_06060, partial [Janthinobacterium lividum]
MEITPFLLTKHLSGLVGRSLTIVRADKLMFSLKFLYACYDLPSSLDTAVIKIDLCLLATLSGLMIGIPNATIEATVRHGELGDELDDPAKEIMNVMAAIFQERRVMFKGLFKAPEVHSQKAADIA